MTMQRTPNELRLRTDAIHDALNDAVSLARDGEDFTLVWERAQQELGLLLAGLHHVRRVRDQQLGGTQG